VASFLSPLMGDRRRHGHFVALAASLSRTTQVEPFQWIAPGVRQALPPVARNE